MYYRSVEGAEVALWKATERTDFFVGELRQQGFPIDPADKIKHPEKVHQWFASRYLLCEIFPEAIQIYRHQKPVLYNGPEISFSHSKDVVAVIVSENPSGIDVQWADPKLKLIASRFVNAADLEVIKASTEIISLSIIWSIKEAVFKKYGTGMPFKSIYIDHYDPVSDTATVKAVRENSVEEHKLVVDYIDGMSLAYVLV